MKKGTVLVVLLLSLSVAAQESPGYRLSESTFNAGGHPRSGSTLGSDGYRISADSVGGNIVAAGLGSESFHMDASFIATYSPPGEVHDLRFSNDETLVWNPEKSAGAYNLYRDPLSVLSGLGYGQCEQWGVIDATATDGSVPLTSHGYFYLVTAENRLAEEGPKGIDSDGVQRPNSNPCP